MLLPYVLLFLPLLLTAQESQPTNTTADREMIRNDSSGDASDWIGESFLIAVDTFLPVSKSCDSTGVAEGKAKKFKLNKYILPLIVGLILIKSILLPIALKTLAVLSGKAVILSLMSLILAAIVGLKKVARESSEHVYHKNRRQDAYDFISAEAQEFEPYRFYKERRRKK